MSEILHYSKKLDVGLRLWETFPSKDFDYFCETYRSFKRLAHRHIVDSIDEDQESESLVRDLKMAGYSAEIITSIATELLFGGVDTTSHSVIFSLYLLANNREQQEVLRQELDTLQPESWAVDLLRLPYLKAVIQESMRMLPTSPANIRQIQSALSVWPSGGEESYQLDPGTSFILCHHTMSNSSTWVRHPQQFLPDRWRRGSNMKVLRQSECSGIEFIFLSCFNR